MKPMNEIHKGSTNEVRFISKAYEKGFTASLPISPERYDLILDNGTRLLKVQIKSTSSIDKSYNSKLNTRYKISTQVGKQWHGKQSRPYTEGDIDILAAYIVPLDIWYLLPVEEISSKKGINVCPENEATKGKYEKYREAWNLLESK